MKGESSLAHRGNGIQLRVTRMLLDAPLVVLGAVTAFWWFVPATISRLVDRASTKP